MGEVKKGLEGVVVDESRVCMVDGEEGKIWYAGYDMDDLARESSYEELLFLLWNDRLPTADELKEVRAQVQERRALPDGVADLIDREAEQTGPMDLLRTAVSALASYDEEANDLDEPTDKCLGVIAKMPTVIARAHRVRQGEEPVGPRDDLGHAANFLYMLNGEEPTEGEASAMDSTFILYAEHGMNASTFSACVTASTLANVYSSLTSAVGTLQGPLHGGATETVIEMLEEVGDASNAEGYVEQKVSNKEKLPGFGHRVYSTVDPRCGHFKRHIEEVNPDSELLAVADAVREEVEKRLGDKGIWPNTDLYSGTLYRELGVPAPFYTTLFAASRAAGWSAHIAEQLEDNRIMRPRVKFVGETGREYAPVEER